MVLDTNGCNIKYMQKNFNAKVGETKWCFFLENGDIANGNIKVNT